MKLLKTILITGILLSAQYTHTQAQRYADREQEHIFYMGIGTGLDYGGIGLKGEIVTFPYLGIFAGLGYNFQGLGANGGLSFKALPFKRVSPTVQAMYGYNAVITVKGASEYNKTYYGASVGAGLDFKLGRNDNKLYFAIYYPFRAGEFYDDMDELKANPSITFESEPLPVTFSIGFNFGF